MDLIEISEKERLSREEAAARLHASPMRWGDTTRWSSNAAACASRCMSPTR